MEIHGYLVAATPNMVPGDIALVPDEGQWTFAIYDRAKVWHCPECESTFCCVLFWVGDRPVMVRGSSTRAICHLDRPNFRRESGELVGRRFTTFDEAQAALLPYHI